MTEYSLILDNEYIPSDKNYIVIGQSIPKNTIVDIGTHISLNFQVCESDEILDTGESIDEEFNNDDENFIESTSDLNDLPDIESEHSTDLTPQTYETISNNKIYIGNYIGQYEDTIDNILKNSGIIIQKKYKSSPQNAKNIVYRVYKQSVEDGTYLEHGDTLLLYFEPIQIEDNDNSDSENIRIEVPNFIGQTEAEMESLKYSTNLNIKYVYKSTDSNKTVDYYKVIYQTIVPNELVPINTTIEVHLLPIF